MGPRDLERMPTQAKQHYMIAAIAVAAMSVAVLVDMLYLHPPPPSTQQKTFGLLLVLLGLYTRISLYAEHQYYVKAARHGCAPVRAYPRDVYGLRYLALTAREIKTHGLLTGRRRLLDELGHTFRHRVFPDAAATISTDEPGNVRAVLGTRFGDWAIPSIRARAFLPVLGRHSIFTTNGAEWQHSRAVLRPAFVRDQISDLACFDRHIARLVVLIPKGDGARFDLQALFSMLTTDTISDFMFGHSTDTLGSAPEDALRFGRYFDASMQMIANNSRLGWISALLPDRKLNECSRFMRAFVTRYLNEVKQQQQQQQNEMTSRDDDDKNTNNSNSKKYMFLNELLKSGESDEMIRDHLMSMFTAGRDTTTSVLTYLFFELSRRPDVVAAIRREIGGLGEADPTWEHLRSMTYLNWAIKEALRLNPPVAANQREAVRDTVLPTGGGSDGKSPVFVTAGMNLRYLPWSMHRRKDIYGDDAEEFRPERWGDLRVTYEYVPFNAGPRICIGQQFALTQIAMITFRLLQAFKAIERKDDRPPIQKLGINTSMLYGCWVSMTPA